MEVKKEWEGNSGMALESLRAEEHKTKAGSTAEHDIEKTSFLYHYHVKRIKCKPTAVN